MLAEKLDREIKSGDKVSIEEYEIIAKEFVGKVEYIDGRIYMFAGALANHSRVKNNIIKKLIQLVKEPSEVMSEDAWFYSEEDLNTHIIPDIMIVCDWDKNVVDNKYKGKPKFIIEISSSSTIKYDKNEKKDKYKELGIEEYIIIYPEDKYIEVFELQKHNFGITHYLDSEEDFIFESNINKDIKISLKDIFDRI